eukprot:TRINITY_DN3488_c0_g1_i1.p1 TRINITY_DN3488_c0_g1~~TRINITY_DN3488_c0_g1_i1.p1  ORF type:complete len:127 (-),score=31.08 TRINITY_DN3488_c0_g1_i1:8-343(-)
MWESFHSTKTFPGWSIDLTDGFIHLSTAEQYPGTLNRFFAGTEEDLVLIGFNVALLDSDKLKWEAPPDMPDFLFPHYYDVLPLEAVVDVVDLKESEEGVWCVGDVVYRSEV